MKLSLSRHEALVVTAALTALVCVPAAEAQANAGDDAATSASAAAPVKLEEVVVTARKTRENLQTTPVSITALTAADIDARGLNNVLQIAQSTPDLTIMSGGNYSGKSALTYIRGVGQDQFTFAFQPGVGYYVDDVYYGTVYGSIFELGDISDVQVLRGPQGTLFGKNNEGGAILLSTPEPKGDDSGEFEAGYGSYDRVFLKGFFDVPLIADKLSLRVFGASNSMSGYVDRIDYACAHPGASGNLLPATTLPGCKVGTEGGDDERTLDGALKWTPTGDLSSILRASLHIDRSEAGADTLILQNPTPAGSDTANYNTYVALPLYGLPVSSPAYVSGSPYRNYASYTDPGTGYSAPPVNDETFWSVADATQWSTPWRFRVKNILAYQRYHAEFSNTDGTPIPTYLEDNILPYHQVSEELDLSGTAFEGRFEWIAGAYYFKSTGAYQGHIELPSAVIVEPGILTDPTIFPYAPNGVYGLNFNINDVTEAKSRSGFLHGVYHVTDKLSLELGGRYSQDRKSQSYDHTYTTTNPVNILLPAGTPAYPPSVGGETDDNRFDPKAAIQYQWTRNLMTYVSYATGYKAGGINPKPVLATDIVPFKEETLKAYEAGVKSEWLDHRLLVNADAYYSDYTNLQLSEFLPPPLGDGGTIVINAGHARIEGAEADLKAVLARGLSLEANGSYLDYKTLSLGAAAGQVGGPTLTARPPYVPRWQGSFGAEYDHTLGSHGIVTARADWSYRSKVYFDLANTQAGAQGGYGLLNVRLAWTNPDGNWTTALEVTNATDKRYFIAKTVTLNVDGSLFSVDGPPGMPIAEFFTVARKF
jgi:iron complex outermembrane receptor protein